MTVANELLKELREVSQKDDAGRHFTQWLDWIPLEEAGLVEIHRPVHKPTGIAYDSQYWSIGLTAAGEEALKELD